MRFQLVATRAEGMTRERYFYEWGNIHACLMLNTPSVLRIFRRYIQNFCMDDIDSGRLLHPLGEQYDNFAEHVIETSDHFEPLFRHSDYVLRMQPHKFSAPGQFLIELTSDETLYEEDGFEPGGIKLVHVLYKKPELTHEAFARILREEHAPAVLAAARPLLRKYAIYPYLPMAPEVLEDTLFAMAGVGKVAAFEEFWFRSLDDLYALRGTPEISQAITNSEARFVDGDRTFSLVVIEREIFDFTAPEGKCSPLPAVLTPGTLEHQVYLTGLTDFNKVAMVTSPQRDGPPAVEAAR
jgi:EthD domain